MTNKYIIWGNSDHALVLNEILRSQRYDVVALIDNVAIHYGESGFYDWLRIQENIESILSVIAIGGAVGEYD